MRKGTTVNIYNTKLSGQEVFEGKAKLIEKLENLAPGVEYWKVEFEDEPGKYYMRTVFKENKKEGRRKCKN
ncbi:MAG: hypothetical protein ACOC5G_04080 [Acidobacteriota bacterium]